MEEDKIKQQMEHEAAMSTMKAQYESGSAEKEIKDENDELKLKVEDIQRKMESYIQEKLGMIKEAKES